MLHRHLLQSLPAAPAWLAVLQPQRQRWHLLLLLRWSGYNDGRRCRASAAQLTPCATTPAAVDATAEQIVLAAGGSCPCAAPHFAAFQNGMIRRSKAGNGGAEQQNMRQRYSWESHITCCTAIVSQRMSRSVAAHADASAARSTSRSSLLAWSA